MDKFFNPDDCKPIVEEYPLNNGESVSKWRQRNVSRLVAQGFSDDEIVLAIGEAWLGCPNRFRRSIHRSIDYARNTSGVFHNISQPQIDYQALEEFRLPKNKFISTENLSPLNQLKLAISVLFEPNESLCIVPGEVKGSHTIPTFSGCIVKWSRIQRLQKTYPPMKGGWFLRINPTTGSKDEDVTDLRYILCESDDKNIKISEQICILLSCNLPFRTITYSGSKSIHGICDIGSPKSIEDYHHRRERVWKTLECKGFKVDRNTKNPSRLSRLPGVFRKNILQKLLFVSNCSKKINWI